MRPIDADLLLRNTINNPNHAPYITKKDVQALPTIEPERQMGEWIEISSINHTYKCSECGRLLVNVTDGRNNVSKHYPYCHCGAKMKGER